MTENNDEASTKRYKKTGISFWLAENWRSLAFVTYFLICLGDFLILPLIYAGIGSLDATTLVHLSLQYKDPSAQIEFIHMWGPRVWTPITLSGGGAFHMAFGAILTAAGYTRGVEKITQIQQGNPQSPIV